MVPPIHPSTIYALEPDGSSPAGLAYTRADNPTYDHAEHLLAALEGGAAGMLFASGSALLRRLVPGVVAVIDATDHAAATTPFFAPGKR